MKRFLCVLMLVFLMLLFCCGNQNNLINYVSGLSIPAEILVDKNNEKLVKFDSGKINDFIKGLCLQNYNEFILEDRVVIEGYSNKIFSNVSFSKRKINIQISVFDGCCLVGSPIIKTSF